MESKKEQVNVRLLPRQKRLLKKLATRSNTTITQVVLGLIARELKRGKVEL